MDTRPAFPEYIRRDEKLRDGMMLVDYFAAAALTGLIANPNIEHDNLVVEAYEIAESMMQHRRSLK